MAQNSWYVKKSKALRTNKLEKIINKFNEEYHHLMYIPKFKSIRSTLLGIFDNSDLIIEKKTFNIVSISCIAQIPPQSLNNAKDGISIYLSKFMLKVNHDVEGFSLCFTDIKLKEKEPKIISGDSSVMFLKISFKLLNLVLKENSRIKVKINKIEPSKIYLNFFHIIEATYFEEMLKYFRYDHKSNTFRRDNKIYSINDVMNFTIKNVTSSDTGSNVKLIGHI
ncbi:conserved Plasmodium protein, unknown function [Plasmodium malariae]|uniref:RNA polymerase Rpb7-like N-terminal domain-containing protein n=1 Tax=Plasmodium malariae TaxID=5858 RepID=A0A1C3KAV1_PLAMA|nr:conserved Plasmodium protein, unknown function [Plasmodium malariae]